MKRLLILICPFILVILSSCDSPVGDINSESPQVKPGQVQQKAVLTHTPVAQLDSVRKDLALQFSARHGYGWKASWRKNGATPSAVFGGTTQPIKGSARFSGPKSELI